MIRTNEDLILAGWTPEEAEDYQDNFETSFLDEKYDSIILAVVKMRGVKC